MSNVEQEADNSKSNSEESDVVLKNQQMVRVQQMSTVERIQQKRKDKDSADDIETTASWTYKDPAGTSSKNDQQAATMQPVEGTQIQQMVCDDTTSWCKSNDDQLECKSIVDQQLVATAHPVESFNESAVAMHPVAKIQTQR
ncbi:hypothetical protein F511_33595 [Dorcoceras hygrometricum]|uniref:Uncharacterized protein n=1 Tax=Dorcoceras hygrometricum TaxID=472368 RepID=A0A2Z7B891_9LAMI|nr:hypothetical protein F511_33595 [Dorcoceras hygrometricum]